MSAPDDLRIWSRKIGPLQWNRANCSIIQLQENMSAIAVVSLGNAQELLAAERMEWMQDAHKTRRFDGSVRIPA